MKTSIIGSGFAGLSTAAILARNGYSVDVFEKNSQSGGRARQFKCDGYTFDMGPSWYWMPDVFDKFFQQFDKTTSDYYELIKLNPGFQVIFDNMSIPIPDSFEALKILFENIEPGSAKNLENFMLQAELKYKFGMDSLVYNPGLSISEFLNKGIVKNIFKLDLLKSYKTHVASYFKNPKLRKLLEFPVLFLGTAPKNTPALYSLMAYSGFIQGTYYPRGGFYKVIQALQDLCQDLGVNFHNNEDVQKLHVKRNQVHQLTTSKRDYKTELVVGTADYVHIEQDLLDRKYHNYSVDYWNKKTFSPSCLLFYLGVNKKINKLLHHNLFFDSSIEQHIKELYDDKVWPTDPLFYVCCPSKTDLTVAPEGKENLFLLMPITPGLKDTEQLRIHYFDILIKRLEQYTGDEISQFIEFKKSYCINDFVQDYNAYKGNAYGLANTLFQTANFKPSIVNKKVSNLYYSGQLTVPGPGVPPALISGQVVAQYILQNHSIR